MGERGLLPNKEKRELLRCFRAQKEIAVLEFTFRWHEKCGGGIGIAPESLAELRWQLEEIIRDAGELKVFFTGERHLAMDTLKTFDLLPLMEIVDEVAGDVKFEIYWF